MENESVSFYSILDIKEKKKELRTNWECFVDDKQKPEEMRNDIYQSWKRCQEHGVNPWQKQTSIVLSENYLNELNDRSQIYNASTPVLEELEKQIIGTGHLITLCDNTGRIIYLRGDNNVLSQAQNMNFVKGADWSEKKAGTNAIGTSLASGKPLQVFAYEHFCEGVHPWNCSASPIKDPYTGELLGILDLTGPESLAQPHSLSIVQSITMLIQQNISERSKKVRRYLLEYYEDTLKRYNADHSTILLDSLLNVVSANSNCLSLLQIKDWEQLWFMPELLKIRTTILSNTEAELNIYLTSLQLNVHVQRIVYQSEQVGFILHLEKNRASSPSQLEENSHAWKSIIGQSETIQQSIRKAKTSAPTNMPILITGESGTGKEQFAQAIHKASLRPEQPFLTINCGAIPKELISSELFGYEPGAFTGGNPKGKKGIFEEAEGGTLLLDEIGEMPQDLQVYLLRVLQENEIVRLGASRPIPINVRVIATTNKNLIDLVHQEQFRTDLYYRLNVIDIKLPSLKDRNDDILLLCDYFIESSAKKLNKGVPILDKEVTAYFQQYHWPGNIREMKNVIDHAVLFCQGSQITLSTLPDYLQNFSTLQRNADRNEKQTLLEQEEKQKIMQLLKETEYNISEVARQCGIARTTLYRKIKKYKL